MYFGFFSTNYYSNFKFSYLLSNLSAHTVRVLVFPGKGALNWYILVFIGYWMTVKRSIITAIMPALFEIEEGI